jgi:hypothetical protein
MKASHSVLAREPAWDVVPDLAIEIVSLRILRR